VKSPNYKTDAATIVVMALFTVVLEFDGGTYISQVRAASAHLAAIKHVALLASNKTIGPTRKRLAVRLAGDKPVGIKGLRNVWCCSATVGKKFALVNIVATAASQ
jgi:hypothetical protein